MNEVKKGRRERSRATRKAIIAAAHLEFTAHGFHGATIAAIAERAGVAPQTIYFVFNTKANLISAVIDSAVMGADDDPLPPQAQTWWHTMLEEPDAVRSLQLFVRGAGPAFARASTIGEILAAAARTDDEIKETFEHHQNLRREAFGQVLDSLATKGDLRSDISREQLLDVFLVVYSDATYHVLTTEMGWPHEQVMDWLCTDLPPLLIEPIEKTSRQ
jgi:AcrR family transcriptional regulator